MERMKLADFGEDYDANKKFWMWGPGRGDAVLDRRVLGFSYNFKFAPYSAELHYRVDAIPAAKQLFSVVLIGELNPASMRIPSFQELIATPVEVEQTKRLII